MANDTPQHVAIIMDGNGRWAKRRGLPRIMGHRAGIKALRDVIDGAKELGIKALTLYTFSSENWKRPAGEIRMLMKLLDEYLVKEEKNLIRDEVRFNAIGRIEELSEPIYKKIKNLMKVTSNFKKFVLTLALNYGGRREIVDAAKGIVAEVKSGKRSIGDIDEETFSKHLYTCGLPEVDLLIRTSGELRVSNFLLWQISYSEIYVTNKLWPDFRKEDLGEAVEEYKKRDRRFGGH